MQTVSTEKANEGRDLVNSTRRTDRPTLMRSILRHGPLRYSNSAHPVTDILPHSLGVGAAADQREARGRSPNVQCLVFLLRKGFGFVLGLTHPFWTNLERVQAFFLLSTVRRKRNDSVPVSIMCARSVIRSNSALHKRGFGNTVVHSENGRLVVTMIAARSARSEITWNRNSAPMSANGTYPTSSSAINSYLCH